MKNQGPSPSTTNDSSVIARHAPAAVQAPPRPAATTPPPTSPPQPAPQAAAALPPAAAVKELALDRNLRLWDAIHLQGHTKPGRMRLIAAAMDPSDPNRPALSTLLKWVKLRKCGACLMGAPIHPSKAAVFPPRPHEDHAPGTVLYLDGLGKYPVY